MKNVLISLAAIATVLSACGAPKQVASVDKVRSPKHALKLLNDVDGGVITTTYAGDAAGARNTGFNTKFFNMGFSSTEVDVPLTVTVELGNTPAAQRLRADGVPIYTYARPRYELSIRNNKTKDNYKRSKRFNLPNTSLCDGYYVVLHPGNDYKRSWSFETEVEIREKSTGIDAGMWGSNLGARDWEAREISDANVTKSLASLAPYQTSIKRKYTKPCFPDDSTRQAWKR